MGGNTTFWGAKICHDNSPISEEIGDFGRNEQSELKPPEKMLAFDTKFLWMDDDLLHVSGFGAFPPAVRTLSEQ